MMWPSHAYIPGKNERHPEDAFEDIRASAKPGATPEQLSASAAFTHGMQYLENGYYWEAHEVLEPVWMALPTDSGERQFVQGIIQLANALLKQEMERPRAVLKLCRIARELLAPAIHGELMGVEGDRLIALLEVAETRANLSI